MLIGGDDSNDVITLGTCFSIFVYIRVLIGRYLTAQSMGSQRGIGGEIQFQRHSCKPLSSAEAPAGYS